MAVTDNRASIPSVAANPWQRSSSFEDPMLEHVMGRAGIRGPAGEYLAELVRTRLDKGAIEYGAEGYLTADVFGELAEEPQDIVGWALLGCLRSYLDEGDGKLTADQAQRARDELVGIAVDGARLWARAEALRQLLAI